MTHYSYGCSNLKPPQAAARPHTLECHGHQRVDEYYWLRERENPAVISWLNAENAYREAIMASTLPLQQKLCNELKDRIPQDDQSAKYPDRGYLWYSETVNGQQYAVHYRQRVAADNLTIIGDRELVLNENVLADNHDFCDVGELQVSVSGRFVAWPVDLVGRRFFEIQIRDMTAGNLPPEIIPDTTGNMVFAEDDRHLFYTKQDPESLRYDSLFRHELGTDPQNDQLIYFEKDEQFNLFLLSTKSRRYIQCVSMQTSCTEVRLIDTQYPLRVPSVFLPREPNHEYSLDHAGNRFVVLTNWQAPNNRLMQTTSQCLADKAELAEILPHDPAVLLEEFELLDNWIVVALRLAGLTKYHYCRNDELPNWQSLEFDEACYATHFAATALANTDKLRIAYSSFKSPPRIVDINLRSKETTVVKQEQVLSGFDSQNYLTERVWATATDGTKIPISLIRHRNTQIDGTAPLLLYAYGSYGICMEDEFSAATINLVDRGFIFAIVHVRGGRELGRHWYEDGKLLKKKNTFTDFIDCTKHLIEQRYSGAERVFAQGGSAGGLLMGAIANLAPDLYRGIIAEVPFLDVVTTMLDEHIPLTTTEYEEWGNPMEKQHYDYMLSYSPYDNVRRHAYPHMLVQTGFHDSQVQYWEPAKWVARLRNHKTDHNLLLLDVDMNAGHGGTSGRYDRYKEIAKMQAFLLMLCGIEE